MFTLHCTTDSASEQHYLLAAFCLPTFSTTTECSLYHSFVLFLFFQALHMYLCIKLNTILAKISVCKTIIPQLGSRTEKRVEATASTSFGGLSTFVWWMLTLAHIVVKGWHVISCLRGIRVKYKCINNIINLTTCADDISPALARHIHSAFVAITCGTE